MTIVDRHAMFVEVLENALWARGYRCRCVATDGMTTQAVLRRIIPSRPGVVLLSLDLGFANGSAVLDALTREGYRVVVMTETSDPVSTGEALVAGADAVVSKRVPLDLLLETVHLTLRGISTIDDRDRDGYIEQYETSSAEQDVVEDRIRQLSRHEREVLAHLMLGLGAPEVARLRTVSEGTVRSQVRSILGKLGVSSQLSAVALAWVHGYNPHSLLAP